MNNRHNEDCRRQIDLVFKKTVVNYYKNHDYSLREVARKFEISPGKKF